VVVHGRGGELHPIDNGNTLLLTRTLENALGSAFLRVLAGNHADRAEPREAAGTS
jgi:hypothetical protein